jgi:hypothetical protein
MKKNSEEIRYYVSIVIWTILLIIPAFYFNGKANGNITKWTVGLGIISLGVGAYYGCYEIFGSVI